MEILGALLIVLAVVGSTLGDEQATGCSLADDPQMELVLILRAIKCLVPGGGDGPNIDFLGRPEVSEEARTFFEGYCADSPLVSRCLHEVNDVWVSCHDRDTSNHFALLRDFFETSLEVACVDNGARLVRIYQELQPNPENPGHVGFIPFMQDCMREAGLNFVYGDAPLPERIFSVYARMKFLRRCFADRGREVYTSTEGIRSLFGEIRHRMKCLHPVTRVFVLCSALNEDGSGDRECPRRFADTDVRHVAQRLIDDGFQCFYSPVDVHGNELPKGVPETQTGEFVVSYCGNLTSVKDCLAEVTSSARFCLANATRHDVFEIFQEMLETSLEVACSEKGVPATRIFFGNYERSASDEARDVLGLCMDVSVTRIRHVPDVATEDAAAMSLRMYREVGAFSECVARDLDQDTVKKFADSFLNEVMDKIKCARPGGGDSVPCKSIVDAF